VCFKNKEAINTIRKTSEDKDEDSETKIGKAVKGRRGEYTLATKTVSREPKGGLRDLETSLRELQTDLPIREMLKRADRVLRTG